MQKKTRTMGILLLVLIVLLVIFFGLKKWNTSKSEKEEKKKENAVATIKQVLQNPINRKFRIMCRNI